MDLAATPNTRPKLSITLPRNFTFHDNPGHEPKTPEVKPSQSPPHCPQAIRPYRLKRRPRPTLTNFQPSEQNPLHPVNGDDPLPSVELATQASPRALSRQSRSFSTALGSLIALNTTGSPRTPEPRRRPSIASWMTSHEMEESINRPLSRCSLLSDSSDDSTGSLISWPAGDGSCTSPESETSGFRLPTSRGLKTSCGVDQEGNAKAIQVWNLAKSTGASWTPEMDNHLWSTYLVYLQDPTVTPFKMLPGMPPPLGVCHRVAREAKKTWKGAQPRKATGQNSVQSRCQLRREKGSPSADSPTTIRATRSGSVTPTEQSPSRRHQSWPKSGSSTRRRLRQLCKKKPALAPHYQRMLQSRSPSPFSSSSRPLSRSHSRLSEVSSPTDVSLSAFETRDVQLSLTTSTADSMQPDGPLAQLAEKEGDASNTQVKDFNEPPVPFASEIPIPSDLGAEMDEPKQCGMTLSPATPRLGSPFAFHTWGPSQSRQRTRPKLQRTPESDYPTESPALGSPLQFRSFSKNSSIPKRRARCQYGDDVSPGGTSLQDLENDPFQTTPTIQHRRVRLRGFSLSDLKKHPLQSLPNHSANDGAADCYHASSHLTGQPEVRNHGRERSGLATTEQGFLESPFSGIAPRPTRRRPLARTGQRGSDISSYSSLPGIPGDSSIAGGHYAG